MAKPVIKKSGDGEDWLATYADAITLLMAFFVMILHFKDYDAIEKQQAASYLVAPVAVKGTAMCKELLVVPVTTVKPAVVDPFNTKSLEELS